VSPNREESSRGYAFRPRAGTLPFSRRTFLTGLGFALAGLIVPGAFARAQEKKGPWRVTEVVDGDTLTLDDGREVRLVGLMAPKLSLGRARVQTEPLAEESKAALAALALGQSVTLWFGGAPEDRYGRHLAHLHLPSDLWVQGEMLRNGWARVYSFADNRARVTDMLRIEAEARAARRGIWRLNAYRVLGVDDLTDRAGSYQIVEGKVQAADEVRGRTYLNFGDDWRRDFTVSIAAADRRRFAGQDILGLAGQMVRVRGWVGVRNGPEIVVTHPEQIELLES